MAVKGMRAFSTHQRREIRARLLIKYGPYCQICLERGISKTLARINMESDSRDPRSFSVDHIVATADGGPNVESNMQPAHRYCNNSIKCSNFDKVRGKGGKPNRKPATSGPRLAYTSSSY